MKLSRSKKTARSKGYAFVEFEDLETATIVAEAMNQYMMFGQTLKAHVLEQRQIHPDLFKNVDALSSFRKMPNTAIKREEHNKQRTVSQDAKRIERLKKKENRLREQMKEMGVNYVFPGYSADTSKPPETMDPEDEAVAAANKKKNKNGKKSSSKKKTNVNAATPAAEPTPVAAAPAASTKKAAKAAPAKAASPKVAPTPAPVEVKTPAKSTKKAAATPAASAKKSKK